MSDLLSGMRFGRWTVSNQYIYTTRGERKYLCHCDCGTERYVLERSLKSGGSESCGCLMRAMAKKKNAYDLTDKVFGDLKVLQIAKHQRKNGGVWWTCLCSCGKMCDVPATILVRGKKTHCGCKSEKNYYFADISGRRFHRLVAIYPTKERSVTGSVVWHCRCDCGNELDLSYNELVYSNICSCGCQKKEHNAKIQGFLTRVADTTLNILKSDTSFLNNTSGVRGVYFVKGKWMAKIVFQKKAYYLGSYTDFDAAVQARKTAETLLFQNTVKQYQKWALRAEKDPIWAKENPFEVLVSKNKGGELHVTYSPIGEDEGMG